MNMLFQISIQYFRKKSTPIIHSLVTELIFTIFFCNTARLHSETYEYAFSNIFFKPERVNGRVFSREVTRTSCPVFELNSHAHYFANGRQTLNLKLSIFCIYLRQIKKLIKTYTHLIYISENK